VVAGMRATRDDAQDDQNETGSSRLARTRTTGASGAGKRVRVRACVCACNSVFVCACAGRQADWIIDFDVLSKRFPSFDHRRPKSTEVTKSDRKVRFFPLSPRRSPAWPVGRPSPSRIEYNCLHDRRSKRGFILRGRVDSLLKGWEIG
jgi:hypothetical protein